MRKAARKSASLRLVWGRPVVLSLLISIPVVALGQEQQDLQTSPQQPPPPEPQPPQREDAIVITGSRIPRPNLTAVSPVTVVHREEVKLQGAVLTEDLINSLPQVKPDQGIFISNGATGTSTIDLRALGPSRTLVLINGRRLLPGDEFNPTPDVNTVPTALIQRVEVLTGGASSVYGSDAIAGVVNFILDTDLDGLRLDGQSSFFQHVNRVGGDFAEALLARSISFPAGNVVGGDRQDINAAYGAGFLDGRGHATAYAGYRKVDAVTENLRDFSACTFQGRPDNSVICGGSSTSATGAFSTNFGRFHLEENRTFVPGVRDLFNFAPSNYFQRPDRRYVAGTFANLDLEDALKPYVEVMFMDDRSVAQIAPDGNFSNTASVNCDNPLLSDQQRSLVCFNGNFVGQTPVRDAEGNVIGIVGSPVPFVDPVSGATFFRGVLRIGRRNVEGGPRQSDLRHKSLRILGGMKGELARGLSYDASYLFGRVKTKNISTGFVSVSRLRRSLDVVTDPATGQPVCRSVLTGDDPNCVPWDVFELHAVTAEAAAYLSNAATVEGTVEQRVATAFVTARLQEWGIRSPWAEEGPSLNVGAEYRKDLLDHRPDEVLQSGDLPSTFPDFPFRGSTRVKELFAEARVPLLSYRLIDDLTLEGGYRQSWYTNGESSFTTNASKLALDLTPVRGIRFRASHQRAVRAPNIQELFGPVVFSNLFTDPCTGVSPQATRAQCAFTGVSDAQYGNLIANPFEDIFGYQSIVGGNPDLQSEKAITRSVGVVLQPRFLRNFNATIDWFDIRLKGTIAQIFSQTIMDTCVATGDSFFCDRIHRDATGSLWMTPEGFVDDRLANIGALKVRGVDVGSTYTQSLGRLGSANLEFQATWLDRSIVDNGGLATPFDCAGLYGFICGYPLPRWRHKARLSWKPSDNVSLSLHWRYVGKSRIDLTNDDLPVSSPFIARIAQIDAQNYFDLTSLLRFGRNYQLRAGVHNVFDRQPPIVISGTDLPLGGCSRFCNGNTFPQLYDPLGRYIFIGATIDLKPF